MLELIFINIKIQQWNNLNIQLNLQEFKNYLNTYGHS